MGKFSFGHIFFLICAVGIASLKTYPEVFLRISGRDSWIANAIAFVIMVWYFDYIIKVYLKNGCRSLLEVFEVAFGKGFGKIFLGLFTFGVFLSLVESSAVESSVMHTNFFIESPIWYIALFVIIPGFYVVKNGGYSVMIVIMACIVISVINGINLAILTAHFKDYRRLLPILANGFDTNFFISVVKTIGMYSSVAIVFPWLSRLTSDKNSRKYAFMSNLFVVQMILISTIGLLATFNVDLANVFVYPKLTQTQLISFFGFVASGEFYVVFQIISSWFAKYIATFFSILLLIREFKLDSIITNGKIEIVLSGVIYVLCYLSAQKLINLFKLINIYVYICIGVFFILPLFAFALYDMKKKKENKNIL